MSNEEEDEAFAINEAKDFYKNLEKSSTEKIFTSSFRD